MAGNLSAMGKKFWLLLGLGSLLDLLDVGGRVFLKVFQAALAAELHFLTFVDEGVRLHVGVFIELLAGYHAGLQRIRFGFLFSGLGGEGGAGEQNSSDGEAKDRCKFHR